MVFNIIKKFMPTVLSYFILSVQLLSDYFCLKIVSCALHLYWQAFRLAFDNVLKGGFEIANVL